MDTKQNNSKQELQNSASPLSIPPAVIISQDKLSAFIKIVDPMNCSSDDKNLLDLLTSKGVVYGINKDILADLAFSRHAGLTLVAAGTPPGEPEDERVQLLFKENIESVLGSDSKDKIDYREIFKIPSVEPGTLLAVKHPGRPGTAGTAVTGEKTPPREPVAIELRPGKGAELTKDGQGVKSTGSGRPWAVTRGRVVQVGIEPAYRHQGDVDMKTGNIRFKGRVEITGNITDGMEVQVTDKLNVAGFVSKARILSGGDIHIIKTITGSTVRAGGNSATYAAFEKSFEELLVQLTSLNNAVVQLYSASPAFQEKGFGQVVMALLDKNKKFTGVHKLARYTQDMVTRCKVDLPEILLKTAGSLESLKGIHVLNLKNFDDLLANLNAGLQVIRELKENKASVRVSSIRNSVVETTGNILVDGQGCFSSRLIALGMIQIQGVFRGGELYAREGIAAGELGAPIGTVTMARVDDRATIKARIVHPGTLLQVGNRKYEVIVTTQPVRARLNRQGDLILI
ncbi:MAG: FapA family protein [Bacillota bacterium]